MIAMNHLYNLIIIAVVIKIINHRNYVVGKTKIFTYNPSKIYMHNLTVTAFSLSQ